jgi:hypothetical protein
MDDVTLMFVVLSDVDTDACVGFGLVHLTDLVTRNLIWVEASGLTVRFFRWVHFTTLQMLAIHNHVDEVLDLK